MTSGPALRDLVRIALDGAISAAESHTPGTVTVLDAGCGHDSPLRAFRSRITRLVGADIAHPGEPPAYLDEFVTADLCAPGEPFPAASFDLILMNFALEHMADPPVAIGHLRRALRPGGRLVATTVNRRHPFIATYLAIPQRLRAPLQRLVKASAADAHPLVGACNDPATVRRVLVEAGFVENRLQTVGHLRQAWGRRRLSAMLGSVGDALVADRADRRSSIVAVGWAPLTPGSGVR